MGEFESKDNLEDIVVLIIELKEEIKFRTNCFKVEIIIDVSIKIKSHIK